MYCVPRLRVVPHFSSGIVERAKRERACKSPHARKGDTRRGERKNLSPRRVLPFRAWGDFHARSRFARSTIPEEKWGTTLSLLCSLPSAELQNWHWIKYALKNPYIFPVILSFSLYWPNSFEKLPLY